MIPVDIIVYTTKEFEQENSKRKALYLFCNKKFYSFIGAILKHSVFKNKVVLGGIRETDSLKAYLCTNKKVQSTK